MVELSASYTGGEEVGKRARNRVLCPRPDDLSGPRQPGENSSELRKAKPTLD